MILTVEQLYVIAYLTGEKKKIFNLPFPTDKKENELSYKEIIDIGWKQLEKDGLVVDGKPIEKAEFLIIMMSEYLRKGNYLVIDHFTYAIDGASKEMTAYIEEVEGGKYRLNMLVKPIMIAGIMKDRPYLMKLEKEVIGKWHPESLLNMQAKYGKEEGVIVSAYHDYQLHYQSVLIDNKKDVIEYDLLNERVRNMSAPSAVLLITELMKARGEIRERQYQS